MLMEAREHTATPFAAMPARSDHMGLARGGLAAFGAWKLGGGIIGTILVFLLLYWLLGIVF
ncbi:MAG: hypothetical protein H7Y88_12360 [Phycisphaerales bacterium]|nr:hypothetical protein [Phycisphaerales bacterium]